MAKMDWLENNAYTKQQNRSANLTGALAFLLFALLWGWPVFHIWQDTCNILQADANTTVEGYVEQITHKRIEVHIEYNGKDYTVRNQGHNFTWAMHDAARKTRRVTVYVNPDNPEKIGDEPGHSTGHLDRNHRVHSGRAGISGCLPVFLPLLYPELQAGT